MHVPELSPVRLLKLDGDIKNTWNISKGLKIQTSLFQNHPRVNILPVNIFSFQPLVKRRV